MRGGKALKVAKPVFPPRAPPFRARKLLKDICEAVPIPAVAIGGLNAGNMDVLEGAGMSGMAVVSAIMKAEDPQKNARELKEKIVALMGK